MLNNGKLPDLETDRLRLRGLRVGDEAFLAMLDSDPLVMRHIHKGPLTCGAARQWARWQVERDTGPRPYRQIGKWIVELRGGPTRMGWVELSHYGCGEVSLGYEFAPAFWGHGYAREAVSRMIDHLFGPLEREALTAYAQKTNKRSLRLLKALGFRRTNRTVRDEGNQLCTLRELSAGDWTQNIRESQKAAGSLRRVTVEDASLQGGAPV